MERKIYSIEFKLNVVNQVLQEGKSISKLSKELKILDTMISRWIYEYKNYGEKAFTGNGKVIKNKDFEIRKLKQQVQELEMENKMLKNTTPSWRTNKSKIRIHQKI